MNRQKLILFLLLILLAALVIRSYINWPRQKSVATLKYPPGTPLQAEKKRPSAVVAPTAKPDNRTLRLDLLNREQASFKGYHRNLFKPIFTEEKTGSAPRSVKAGPKLVRPLQPPIQQPQPSVAIPETPRQELAKFTFLGFMSKNAVKTIFLAKEKEIGMERDILLVKKGDIFSNGRFQAIALTDQALTIRVTDTGDDIIVPLIENQPLSGALK
jgi:hypothetical protein